MFSGIDPWRCGLALLGEPAARTLRGNLLSATIVATTIAAVEHHRVVAKRSTRYKPPGTTGLAAQIGKTHPFDSPAQEAYLNLIRSAAILSNQFERLFKSRGLSESTYNILRILRGVAGLQGAPPGSYGNQATRLGLPLSEIGERMIAPVPDVTRLIDRLEQLDFAARRRCAKDRRVIYACITNAGLDVLRAFDSEVIVLHQQHLGHMTGGELERLSELLEKARQASPEHRGNAVAPG